MLEQLPWTIVVVGFLRTLRLPLLPPMDRWLIAVVVVVVAAVVLAAAAVVVVGK